MSFQDNLAAMPDIGHLSGLDILDAQGKAVHHIPNAFAVASEKRKPQIASKAG